MQKIKSVRETRYLKSFPRTQQFLKKTLRNMRTRHLGGSTEIQPRLSLVGEKKSKWDKNTNKAYQKKNLCILSL